MLKLVEKQEVIKDEVDGKIELIKQLIPLGLMVVKEVLEDEVKKLVGQRYERGDKANTRWGSNPGSVYVGDKKCSISVPRVRNKLSGEEVKLSSYAKLKDSGSFDEKIFRQVINGISTRKYEKAAEQIPETFGIKKSNISDKFKAVSAKRLQELFERDLSKDDIVSIFIDGKSLRGMQILIALGITMKGQKIPLGFLETSTENKSVCKDFINSLIDRGLNTEQEILFITDGGKGIILGIKSAIGDKAVMQRCQWHKRENIVSYLPKKLQAGFRSKLQSAYELETYEKAKEKLLSIKKELSLLNSSAAGSLDEGLEETLTLHRLGVFTKMGRSFKTTNCIENLNRTLQLYINRVCNWKNSDQRRRWIGSVLLEIEGGFKTVEGYSSLPLLREKMKGFNNLNGASYQQNNFKIAA